MRWPNACLYIAVLALWKMCQHAFCCFKCPVSSCYFISQRQWWIRQCSLWANPPSGAGSSIAFCQCPGRVGLSLRMPFVTHFILHCSWRKRAATRLAGLAGCGCVAALVSAFFCLAELGAVWRLAIVVGRCRLNVEHKLNRAVVASVYLVVYARLLDMAVEALRGDEVVDAPPCVLLPCLETVRPP